MSVSRRDGYDMRLDMLAEGLIALPGDLLAKIFGLMGANEAAVTIQRFFRGLATRTRIPAGGLFGGSTYVRGGNTMTPRATLRSKYALANYKLVARGIRMPYT